MKILIFEHIVFSIWARPGRGLAASSSTSNRLNSKWFKYQKKIELCYVSSTVASDGSYIAYHIVAYCQCSMLYSTYATENNQNQAGGAPQLIWIWYRFSSLRRARSSLRCGTRRDGYRLLLYFIMLILIMLKCVIIYIAFFLFCILIFLEKTFYYVRVNPYCIYIYVCMWTTPPPSL